MIDFFLVTLFAAIGGSSIHCAKLLADKRQKTDKIIFEECGWNVIAVICFCASGIGGTRQGNNGGRECAQVARK